MDLTLDHKNPTGGDLWFKKKRDGRDDSDPDASAKGQQQQQPSLMPPPPPPPLPPGSPSPGRVNMTGATIQHTNNVTNVQQQQAAHDERLIAMKVASSDDDDDDTKQQVVVSKNGDTKSPLARGRNGELPGTATYRKSNNNNHNNNNVGGRQSRQLRFSKYGIPRLVVAVPMNDDSDDDEEDPADYGRQAVWLIICFAILFACVIGGIVGSGNGTNPSQQDVGTGTPTASPVTFPPTVSFDPPTEEDCSAIRNGTSVIGQDDMVVRRFRLETAITLDSDDAVTTIWPYLSILEEQFREQISTELAGCSNNSTFNNNNNNDRHQRRQLNLVDNDPTTVLLRGTTTQRKERILLANNNYIIGNVQVAADAPGDQVCSDDIEKPCKRVDIHLQIYLKGRATLNGLVDKLTTVLLDTEGNGDPLVTIMQLESPFKAITIIKLVSLVVISN